MIERHSLDRFFMLILNIPSELFSRVELMLKSWFFRNPFGFSRETWENSSFSQNQLYHSIQVDIFDWGCDSEGESEAKEDDLYLYSIDFEII